MEYILSGRRGGKTAMMIKRSAEDLRNGVRTVIVCPYHSMAKLVERQAREMHLKIPTPITIEKMVYDKHLGGKPPDRYLLDELKMSLTRLADGVEIEAVTVDMSTDKIGWLKSDPRRNAVKDYKVWMKGEW